MYRVSGQVGSTSHLGGWKLTASSLNRLLDNIGFDAMMETVGHGRPRGEVRGCGWHRDGQIVSLDGLPGPMGVEVCLQV